MNKVKVDDKDLRQRIVHQYGFVDQEDDHRYHRPTIRSGVMGHSKADISF
jgi:hypothetical protein